jgi:hypothetical protein
LGFLELESDKFSPVSFPSTRIDDFAADEQGTRVVFLSEDQAFEWKRSK